MTTPPAGAASSVDSRCAPCGSSVSRSVSAGSVAAACASDSGGPTCGMRARPDCPQAELTTLFQCATRFSARAASSFTSVRSAFTGTMALTPSSVAFCRIRSIFSPRAMPCSRVIASGDSLATACTASMRTCTSRLLATVRVAL